MLRADPRYGFDQIATFIRQQPGMNYTFITAQFIGEVLSLLQLTEEGSGLASGRSETVSPSPGERHQTSLAAPYTNSGNETVKGVKAPVKPGEAGETLVNIHTSGETGKAPGGVQAHAYAPVAQPSRSVNGDHSERITDPEHAAVSAVNHAPFAPEIAQESGRHGQMNFAQIGADFPMHLPTHSERDLSGMLKQSWQQTSPESRAN